MGASGPKSQCSGPTQNWPVQNGNLSAADAKSMMVAFNNMSFAQQQAMAQQCQANVQNIQNQNVMLWLQQQQQQAMQMQMLNLNPMRGCPFVATVPGSLAAVLLRVITVAPTCPLAGTR